jgi:lipoyl-dependent peroxiredoxin
LLPCTSTQRLRDTWKVKQDSNLTITAKIPGIDRDTFLSIAASAKAGCPVSKLMKVEIHFGATLIS